MRRFVLLAGLVATVAGCTDTTGPRDPISGRWRGGASGISIDLIIAREGSSISGSGSIGSFSGVTAVTVHGTWVAPDISLVLSSSGFQDTHLGGQISQGTIDGSLNGSGFNNFEMILSRD